MSASDSIVLGDAFVQVQRSQALSPVIAACFRTEPGESFHTLLSDSEDLYSLIETIIDHGYAQHSQLVYFDAALMVSPQGKSIMLAGASGRGKTTTALALCLLAQFKMVCEDIALIDFSRQIILNFVMPLSIRERTRELLQELGAPAINLIEERWFPCRSLFLRENFRLAKGIDFLFVFESPGSSSEQGLTERKLTAAGAIRSLLPISNLLLHEDACEKMAQVLAPSECYAIKDGSLAERLNFICTVSSAC